MYSFKASACYNNSLSYIFFFLYSFSISIIFYRPFSKLSNLSIELFKPYFLQSVLKYFSLALSFIGSSESLLHSFKFLYYSSIFSQILGLIHWLKSQNVDQLSSFFFKNSFKSSFIWYESAKDINREKI